MAPTPRDDKRRGRLINRRVTKTGLRTVWDDDKSRQYWYFDFL